MNDAHNAMLAALPHGPEFRFVDQLTSLEPGKKATATYTVRGDEAFLAGHFPGYPLMPGVILIEAMAQLAGVIAQCDPEHSVLENMKLTAVRGAKILGSAVPGEVMSLTCEIAGRLGPLIQAQGSISVGERQILTTQITLSGTEATAAT
jgi:3-hydroxyacyl-[acyl-carrier-protein] dehydratase